MLEWPSPRLLRLASPSGLCRTWSLDMQASAKKAGLHVDEYLKSINKLPTMEPLERDVCLAAWKATASQRRIEAEAAAMGMWPEQWLVYTKHPMSRLVRA